MPERYEAIRDNLIKQGKPDPKGMAARIFNASRKLGEAPVTGKAPGETPVRPKPSKPNFERP